MASCSLQDDFWAFLLKANERATEYYESVTWRPKKYHSKVKYFFVTLCHRYIMKLCVFLLQFCVPYRPHLGWKCRANRVLQSEY